MFQSYRRRNSFLLTQVPKQNTVVDLWRLVLDHQCPTIILLEEDIDEVSLRYFTFRVMLSDCDYVVILCACVMSSTFRIQIIVERTDSCCEFPDMGEVLQMVTSLPTTRRHITYRKEYTLQLTRMNCICRCN